MPTWAIAYLMLLFVVTVASVIHDHRDGIPAWRLCVDVASMFVLGWLFAAYHLPALSAPLGRGAAPLLLAAVLVVVVGAHTDMRRIESDPELSARQNLVAEHIGIVLGVLVISPAIALGALAAADAW